MSAKQKNKMSGIRGGSQCVHLELTRPGAQEVSIAGSFNDWHPKVTPMIHLSDGKWAKELSLAPGHYEYRFVVDGQWVDDPAAAKLVPNPFGTANAVLEVRPAPPAQATRPEARADLPPKWTGGNPPSRQKQETSAASPLHGSSSNSGRVTPHIQILRQPRNLTAQ